MAVPVAKVLRLIFLVLVQLMLAAVAEVRTQTVLLLAKGGLVVAETVVVVRPGRGPQTQAAVAAEQMADQAALEGPALSSFVTLILLRPLSQQLGRQP
jgi:hypothetical protein